METIRPSEVGVEAAALRAAAVLNKGGVVLYPTDTLYGLGADALSDEAVLKVQRIKWRDEGKPIHCVVADVSSAEAYADMTDAARSLANVFWPGPLTLVLKKREGVNIGIARRMDTIGIRVPDNEFCLTLARTVGKPYTTTSANVSGETSYRDVRSILDQLGGEARIDLVVDAGELPLRAPSTVVDLTGTEPKILREGAIRTAEILSVLEHA